MRVILSMIVRNEEKEISDCLKQAFSLVDEAIIIDTGSADRTISLIKESPYPAKVLSFPWQDDFAAARNFGLTQITNADWILILDADERLYVDKPQLLSQLSDTTFDGFCVPLFNQLKQNNLQRTMIFPRLIRPGFLFSGRIHEQLSTLQNYEFIDEAIIKIVHHGYNLNDDQAKIKSERNRRLLLLELAEHPQDPHLNYLLGIQYLSDEQPHEALTFFLMAQRHISQNAAPFIFDIPLRIADCLYRLGNYDECLDFIDAIVSEEPFSQFVSLHFLAGNCWAEKMQYAPAFTSFKRCLEIGENSTETTTIIGYGSFYPKLIMARMLAHEKRLEEAGELYLEAIADRYNTQRIGLDEAKNFLALHQQQTRLAQLTTLAARP